MTFALTVAFACTVGLAVLRSLRLGTGHLSVDVPLAWFVGSGWFAVAAMLLRFTVVPSYSRGLIVAITFVPILALVSRRMTTRGGEFGPVEGSVHAEVRRWVPRPIWGFLPLVAYVAFVTIVICLHGFNTPTSTDDALRVRAFTPMLAFDDHWGDAARGLLAMAGAVPTFVPTIAWRLTGNLDHFHVNYVVLTDLVAVLVLTVSVSSARGAPERGWATAFALLSLPFFMYHCTSTYQDAVLAMFVGASFVWTIEYATTRDPADAARGLLVLAVATMVKREGLVVAAVASMPIVAGLAWQHRRRESVRWTVLALCCLPAVLHLAATIAAAGVAQTFPFLRLAMTRTGAGVPIASKALDAPFTPTLRVFGYALFQSGNAGLLYWILPAAIVLRPRIAARRQFALPLAAVAAVFSVVAASSLWLVPAYTLDQSTVHRALLTPSVLGAIWVAAFVTDRSARCRAQPPDLDQPIPNA